MICKKCKTENKYWDSILIAHTILIFLIGVFVGTKIKF